MEYTHVSGMARKMGKIKIQFLLGKLNPGGAERQLIALLEGLDKERFLPLVITYYQGGSWESKVKNISGVKYESLRLKGRVDIIRLLAGLSRISRTFKPHILFGLMGDACTVSLFVGRLFKNCKVIWGLRASNMDFTRYSKVSGIAYKLNALLSSRADLVISNSWVGKKYHISKGYCKNKITVVPNGIDTKIFQPAPEAGKRLCKNLGIPSGMPVIGRIGRIDPMKDYKTFFKACSLVSKKVPQVHFIIAGDGPPLFIEELKALNKKLGISNRVFWLGQQEDIVSVYNACTVTCSSSSFGEGFPNAVAESLSCEVLCAATDVGDTSIIIGRHGGLVVPPKNSEALAQAMLKLLFLPKNKRLEMEKSARKHIEKNFGIERMVMAYEKVFSNIVDMAHH